MLADESAGISFSRENMTNVSIMTEREMLSTKTNREGLGKRR